VATSSGVPNAPTVRSRCGLPRTDASTTGPRRGPLLSTSAGTHLDAFGGIEWALLAAVALIWGTSFLFMAIGLEAFAPGLITLARVGLGALALALVPRARRTRIHREDLPQVALLGVVWLGIPLLLFPVAQQWIDSSVAGMINAAMPLTTAVWAVVLLRRLPGRTQLIGLVVGFAGIVAVSLPEIPVGATATGTARTAVGTGLVFLAIVLYGLAANLAVPLQQRYGALPVLLRAQVAALLMVAPFGILALPDSRWAWGPALAMLPLGVLGTGLAFVLMATLVGRVGGPRGSVAIYFVPLVAIVAGVVFRAEQVHPLALLGTVLVLAGAWITSRRESLPPPPAGRG
jgi:drug/metabolite transporter (DMT)-like permease